MPLRPGDLIDGKDLVFASRQGCVFYKGQRILLPKTTLEVLQCIHAGHPNFVANEVLRMSVWGTADRDENLPQQHVTKLNKKLREFGFYVQSVPNLGYVLARTDNESPGSMNLLNEQSRKHNAPPLVAQRLDGSSESNVRNEERERQAHSSLNIKSGANAPARHAPIRAGLDELIAVAGLSAFYPSRDYYAKYRDAASIDQYISTATRSVVMVSINLMTGIPIDGVCEALINKFKTIPKFTAIISLLNPQKPHLVASLAPVLNTKPAGLARAIRESLKSLNDTKTELRQTDRGRFSIRVHDTIPMGSAILIDHKESFGRIQIESKVYKAPPRMSFAFEVVRTGSDGFYETLARGYDDLVADGHEWKVDHSKKTI